ncbi:ABC1 kinase family protein [Heyndrickxia camelliae]|uniref:ABC transporter n=1 Tax=Heyndrickxia camelliae TaxID=1707093 RepID=A0A2N3LLY2_9BACI|nr:AarF/ABC1/UbiB kinase family protein [Heyndrickxia camelliae]PKR85640.1 ABC transporter [Heyndrickxia camelliae]
MFEKRVRHLGRYRDIVTAFARNGFGFIIKDLGLFEFLSLPKRLFQDGRQEMNSKSIGERIRLILEELGPTFIKMGQIASTRPDLIPAEVLIELEKLQDDVPPFPFEEVERIIKEELGGSIDTLFKEFQETPLAAASIGQVHYAVLKSNERVAVKIQRPNIYKVIQTDLEILQDLVQLAVQRLDWASRYPLTEIVEEFSKSLQAELNYAIEARNTERVSKQFESDATVHIPKVFWDLSSQKILTLEFMEGIKLNNVNTLDSLGINRKILAERFVQSIFHQILIEGFFHGDPHPGNILAQPGEVIIFLDFGMVGRLREEMKTHIATLIIAMMRKNTEGVIKAVTRMGLIPEDIDMKQLTKDVDDLKEKYLDVPLSQVSLGESINDLFSIAYQHRIQIPVDLTLLGKTLLTMEGTVEMLDPEISVMNIAEPFGRKLLKERLRPKKVAENAANYLFEYGEILTQLPKHIQDLTSTIKKGKLRMEVTVPELEQFLKKLDRISSRLSFSIVLLSFSIIMVGLIIGSALNKQSTLLWNIPATEIGFIIAILMFLWLLFSIFKK